MATKTDRLQHGGHSGVEEALKVAAAVKVGGVIILGILFGIIVASMSDLATFADLVAKITTVAVVIIGFYIVSKNFSCNLSIAAVGVTIAAYAAYWVPSIEIYAVSIMWDIATLLTIIFIARKGACNEKACTKKSTPTTKEKA